MDELDRILGRDEDLRPSAGLTDAVMLAIRNEATASSPMEFPWKRLLAGLSVCLVLFVVGLVLGRGSAGPPIGSPPWSGLDLDLLAADPRIRNLGMALGILVLTWASSRFVVRIAGYKN